MCAIFQLADGDEEDLHAICEAVTRKCGDGSVQECIGHDIYPGGTAIVSGGPGRAARMRWGFPLQGTPRPVFNARAESLEERPLFRAALRHRCLVPATSFYEFDRGHRRYRVALPARRFFYLAGLWAPFHGADGRPGFCFTIVTTPPNRAIGAFHDRMPAILTPQTAPIWLQAGAGSLEVLRPLEEDTDVALSPLPARG